MTTTTRTTTAASGTRPALMLMAGAAGLSAAGNYFAQPLLDVLRIDLRLGPASAGALVAAAQIGYAAGLAVLVPLGDRLPRRGLAATLLAATAVLLAVAGAAPTGPVLLLATALAAVTSVGAQVLVPYAAELAGPERAGRAVAVVMSGVLVGGLAGRAAAGAVADLAGWRSVYWGTSVLLVAAAVVVARRLPASEPHRDPPTVVRLWRSTAALAVQLPALRRPTAVAALPMASYSVHLAALTLLLTAPPFSFSATAVGAFALLGVVGPLAMPLTGRAVDRGRSSVLLRAGTGAVVVAWLIMVPAAGGNLAVLATGVVLLNLGNQAILNAAQTTVYALRPEARSRINAVFMTTYFAAGALGSLAAALLGPQAGWAGGCVLAAALAAAAFGLSLAGRRAPAAAS